MCQTMQMLFYQHTECGQDLNLKKYQTIFPEFFHNRTDNSKISLAKLLNLLAGSHVTHGLLYWNWTEIPSDNFHILHRECSEEWNLVKTECEMFVA